MGVREVFDSTHGGRLFVDAAQTKSLVTRTERGSQGRNIRIEAQEVCCHINKER